MNKKRTLRLLLISLATIMMPMNIWAGIYSITGGANVTISFDTGTYTVTISGTGEMSDWTSSNAPGPNLFPEEYRLMKKIVIEEGITSIGAWVFYNMSNITSVTIANSVTNIKNGAFYNCGTSNLRISLPSSLESIGNEAKVPTDFIPASLTTIGASGLRLGMISTITVDNENPMYYSEGNCIIERNTQKVICGSRAATIPNGALTIGERAFEGISFTNTEITIPESVVSIESKAFYNSNITSITLPANLKEIGFMGFGYTKLQTIICLSETPPSVSPSGICNTTGITLMVPNPDVYTTTAWRDAVSVIVGLPFENISDGTKAEYSNSAERELESITYTRTLPNLHWNALYLPFEIPVSQLTENYDVAYFNDVHSYDDDNDGKIDEMEMEVIKLTSGTLKANYPYLIRAKNEAAKELSITVENATLHKTEQTTVSCSSVFMKFDITGTYSQMTADELDGSLVITTDGAWKQLSATSTLKPFRLYLTLTTLDGSPVKVEETFAVNSPMVTIRVRGEEPGTTSIDCEEIRVKSEESDTPIYNLMGQPVKNPVKGGIYIQGGRKVIW